MSYRISQQNSIAIKRYGCFRVLCAARTGMSDKVVMHRRSCSGRGAARVVRHARLDIRPREALWRCRRRTERLLLPPEKAAHRKVPRYIVRSRDGADGFGHRRREHEGHCGQARAKVPRPVALTSARGTLLSLAPFRSRRSASTSVRLSPPRHVWGGKTSLLGPLEKVPSTGAKVPRVPDRLTAVSIRYSHKC